MLQLQNVRKTYKTKAGLVNALDGISLTFPSSGLVFITGKSGCGKTTLLNVIGGLDGIDGGEILIQDKKFSEFSASEYDSYRNTFIGFIFQEYNLLPEFTVEKNIKIAMELQGRSADDEAFEKLLKDVEIEDFKNRKPSELSGGQRQRVAIARALVKQPRIIMADEPTGALDSSTGVQVLDTLKKLSKETLVIVVSHDRDFAEKYADRIVSLEDGKVVQDVTFAEREIQSNVSEQENVLIVREGAELTEDEKDVMAKAVKERKGIELVPSLSFREKEKTGEVQHDAETPVDLRKSQMKLKSSVALGVKSLGVKPVRLAFTVLISALAFAVFGLFDTIANFNEARVLKNQLQIAPSGTVAANANYIVDQGEEDYYDVKFSQNTVAEYAEKTGGTVKGVFDFQENRTGTIQQALSIAELTTSSAGLGQKYYAKFVNGFVEFDKQTEISENGRFKDFDYTLIEGEYPEIAYENGVPVSESVYQVAISSYLADSLIYYFNGKTLSGEPIESYRDLLGESITVSQQPYTICGIVDCGELPEKYDVLRQVSQYNVETNALGADFNAYIDSGAYKCLFVAKDFLKTVQAEKEIVDLSYIGNTTWRLSVGEEENKAQVESYLYSAEAYGTDNILLFNGECPQDGKIALGDDEILIHYLNLEKLFADNLSALPSSSGRSYIRGLINNMKTGTVERKRKDLAEMLSLLEIDVNNAPIVATIHESFNKTNAKKEKQVKIVGVYVGVDTSSYTLYSRYKLMMNKNLMQELEVYREQGSYTKLLFSENSIRKGGAAIVERMVAEDGFALYWYNNSVLTVIRENEGMLRQGAKLFLYADLALLIFSIFMLYNYISTSIASKKRSVGILRALGAGKKDILLTFFSESLIVSVINGAFASAFAVVGCGLVNGYFVDVMNISVHFALLGVRQFVIISVISLLTAIASSLLPILKIAKKKPVELIRRS